MPFVGLDSTTTCDFIGIAFVRGLDSSATQAITKPAQDFLPPRAKRFKLSRAVLNPEASYAKSRCATACDLDKIRSESQLGRCQAGLARVQHFKLTFHCIAGASAAVWPTSLSFNHEFDESRAMILAKQSTFCGGQRQSAR